MERIWENELLVVERDALRRTVVVRRTGGSAEPEAIVAAYRSAAEANVSTHRGWGLVVDLRNVTGRNDDAFEAGMTPLMHELIGMFSPVVMLVASAVGALQMRRMSGAEGIELHVTHDEPEAIEYCASRVLD